MSSPVPTRLLPHRPDQTGSRAPTRNFVVSAAWWAEGSGVPPPVSFRAISAVGALGAKVSTAARAQHSSLSRGSKHRGEV